MHDGRNDAEWDGTFCVTHWRFRGLVYRPSKHVEYGEDVKGLPSMVFSPVIVGFP
jgi:hypothetical protein